MSPFALLLENIGYRIGEHFDFAGRQTTMRREVRGGVVTFLTMSYILLVNPQILTDWIVGTDSFLPDRKTAYVNNVASSTAAICAIGTLAIGLLGNLPLAVGPGMGMNTFFAGSVLAAHTASEFSAAKESWDTATAATFVCGSLVLLIALTNLTGLLLRKLPAVLKSAILVGIGVYQAFIGLRTIRIIQSEPTQLLKMVSSFDFHDTSATGACSQVLFVFTLLLTSSLYVANVNGAILVGISLTTVVCWLFSLGGVAFPAVPIQAPVFADTFFSMNFKNLFNHVEAVGTSISFVLITLFDVGGVAYGVLALARSASPDASPDAAREAALDVGHIIPAHEEDEERRSEIDRATEDESLIDAHAEVISPYEVKMIFVVVGSSTMMSAVLGCSPCILFLECIAGVASGARTGFASVITSLLFFCSLLFVPLFRNVPLCASSPALVLIGCFMMGSAADIPWNDHKLAMPAFLTIILMPFTASITPGIVAGIVTLAVFSIVDCLVRRFFPDGPTPLSPLGPVADETASSAEGHLHSLGFNVDEPSHEKPGFRVRGVERRVGGGSSRGASVDGGS